MEDAAVLASRLDGRKAFESLIRLIQVSESGKRTSLDEEEIQEYLQKEHQHKELSKSSKEIELNILCIRRDTAGKIIKQQRSLSSASPTTPGGTAASNCDP